METKSLKIGKEIHNEIKNYCNENMLKMNLLIEKIIKDYLERNKNKK